MLGYCTLGTNDLERSTAFYEPIAEILGCGRMMENERSVIWGTPGQGALFCTCKPFDGESASVGNGSMFAFAAESEDQVQRIYDHAIANGGSDEGAPGPRGDGGFYGAYFRDPDGNKLAAFVAKAP